MPDNAARQFQSMVIGLSSVLPTHEITKQAHVSRMTIWRAKSGECRAPSAETFHRIEKVWEAAGRPTVK
jgi:hypothetical protein